MGIHVKIQDTAKQFFDYYEEKEPFSLFLGLIKQRGDNWAFITLSKMKTTFLETGKKLPITKVMKK